MLIVVNAWSYFYFYFLQFFCIGSRPVFHIDTFLSYWDSLRTMNNSLRNMSKSFKPIGHILTIILWDCIEFSMAALSSIMVHLPVWRMNRHISRSIPELTIAFRSPDFDLWSSNNNGLLIESVNHAQHQKIQSVFIF